MFKVTATFFCSVSCMLGVGVGKRRVTIVLGHLKLRLFIDRKETIV
jgi:hypothetical protein